MKQWRTIREIHDAFDRRELSAVELTSQYLQNAKNSDLNAFITIAEEKALAQARQADALIAEAGRVPRDERPLLGIPFGLKDNLVTENLRTTCASKILDNYLPPYSATVVERLEEAGAVILGKLNMDEFAMGGSNENSAFGPVKHPTHPDRVPGGSSGGSAAAVRAELCFAALGSDTGGSIRLPAAYCGVVGFKSTYGRVSRYGLVAFASSLDQVGPLTHTTEDAARIMEVIGGHDPRDSTSLPDEKPRTSWVSALQQTVEIKGLRIGLPEEYFSGAGAGIDTAVREKIDAALEWLERQGATLVPVSLPHSKYAVATYYVTAVSEASSNLERYDGVRFGNRPAAARTAGDLDGFYKAVRANFGDEVKRRILLGAFALSSGYYDAYYRRACQVRRLISEDFDRAFEQVDLIASPVAPTTAFKQGEKSADPLQMYLNDLFTIPANLAGLPAVSLPCGEDAQSLPVGLQLMAPKFQDEKLLSVAHILEKGRGGK